jgi:hypothetical protein
MEIVNAARQIAEFEKKKKNPERPATVSQNPAKLSRVEKRRSQTDPVGIIHWFNLILTPLLS